SNGLDPNTMICHGPKNIFFDSWPNLRRCCAVPLGTDSCGVEPCYRRLVSAEVGKLGSPHRGWCPRSSRAETWPAGLHPFQLLASSNDEKRNTKTVDSSSKRSQRDV